MAELENNKDLISVLWSGADIVPTISVFNVKECEMQELQSLFFDNANKEWLR